MDEDESGKCNELNTKGRECTSINTMAVTSRLDIRASGMDGMAEK
jgi:hypothetical protein